MKQKFKSLIREVDVRNKNGEITTLFGVSISKEFIKSVANIIGTDLSKYKVVRKNQFVCSLMQVSRDERIPIALWGKDESIIVSPAYKVFEVIDEEKVLPEYLALWYKRDEFDREASYYGVGGVRGSLEWEDFCEMEIPMLSLEEQKTTVASYHKIEERIKIKRQINDNLAAQISTIYTNQKGDKSFVVSDECRIFTGKKDVNQATSTGRYKFFSCSPSYLYSDDYIYDGKAVLVAGNGSYTGRTTFVDEKFDLYQRTYGIVPKDSRNDSIIYLVYAAMAAEFVKKTKESLHGSAIPYIVYNDIANFEIYYSDNPTVICDKISVLINVRYSWGISRILNQNSVNSEFVKGRPKTSRSSFFVLYVWFVFLSKKMQTITRLNK